MRKIASLAFIGTLLVLSACHRHGTGDTGDEYDFGIAPDIALALTIAPANPTVQVTPGQPVTTVLFTASIAGTVVPADWTTDRGELGAIDSGGTYTPTGNLGGKGLITASYMGLSATTTITIQYKLVQNGDPKCGMVGMIGAGGYGGVGGNGPGCAASPAQQGVLGGTPSSDSTISWLYPYDATVFPRGLLAPLMMWVPGAHDFDAMLVHMESKGGTFLYDGTFSKPPGAPFINMPIPQATWDVMNYSASGDEVTIKVSFAQGSTFVGPLTVKWRIAAGTLKGIVYYNSYGTGLVTNSDSDDASIPPAQYGAGTLSINPGATDPKLVAGLSSPGNGNGCRVCHSVTKDGSRLITQKSSAGDQDSVTVDLKNGNMESALVAGNSAFPALYPDGTMFFTSSSINGGAGMRNPDTSGHSQLYSLPTGTLLTPTGLPADLQAALPSFSPDGKMVAFNRFGGVGGDRRTLSVMTFNVATTAFGPVTDIFTPAADYKAVWPSFLPTNAGIVFENEVHTNEFAYTRGGNLGQLWWADVATKSAQALSKLNGVGYLPTGAMHNGDSDLNYEPTVNPVPTGGYAWVVFTSRRLYGNVATQDPFLSDPRNYEWKKNVTTKKLWIAAVDINGTIANDPSHPAFYLPGQELYAGNSRGFFTVDPCATDGKTCTTGDECCGGYCQNVVDTDMGTSGYICSSEKPMCAKEFEKCVTVTDCCHGSGIDPNGTMPSLSCINGYCASEAPPIL